MCPLNQTSVSPLVWEGSWKWHPCRDYLISSCTLTMIWRAGSIPLDIHTMPSISISTSQARLCLQRSITSCVNRPRVNRGWCCWLQLLGDVDSTELIAVITLADCKVLSQKLRNVSSHISRQSWNTEPKKHAEIHVYYVQPKGRTLHQYIHDIRCHTTTCIRKWITDCVLTNWLSD